MMFKEATQEIIEYRGGKLRVPGLQPWQYTYYVAPEVRDDALAQGYIDAEGNVTSKFREEYDLMFDAIGKMV